MNTVNPMTLRTTLLLVFACWNPLQATAQSPVASPAFDVESQQIDGQRLAIRDKRQQLEAGFAAEDAVCYRRFAVNNCLQDVDSRRMISIADLRRQDVLLNDQERKRRGADQLRQIEEKQTAIAQQQLFEQRAKVFSDYQSRAKAADLRLQPRLSDADVNAAATGATADRLKASAEKALIRQGRQAEAAQAAEKLKQRQTKAEDRAESRAQQKAAQPPSTVQSLPIPP